MGFRVDQPLGRVRIVLWWNAEDAIGNRYFRETADQIVRQIERAESKMSQEERWEGHAQVYRDVLRPPWSGVIGFEDRTEDWLQ